MTNKQLRIAAFIILIGIIVFQKMGRENDLNYYRNDIEEKQKSIETLKKDVKQRDKQIELLIDENYKLEQNLALQEEKK